MLEIGRTRLASAPRSSSPPAPVPRPLIDAFQLDVLVKHVSLIALAVLLCGALGVAFALLRPATYTATAKLLLDNRELQLSQQDTLVSSVALESATVLSQIEILRSERIGMGAVEALDLAERPEFRSRPGLLSAIGDFFATPSAAPADPNAATRRTARALQRNLAVERLGGSYVLEVAYTSPDPVLSAEVANALVRLYLEDQAASTRQAAQSATAWLRERMQSLGPNARIVSDAAPPMSRDGPGAVNIVAAALVLGLILGLGLALLRELFDDRVRAAEDVSRITDAEFLGSIPLIRQRRNSQPAAGAAVQGEGAAPSAWSFDHDNPALATTLRRAFVAAMPSDVNQGARLLGVTSVTDGEGKTTVAANLARIMGMSGRRVLLVDCDPYRPTLSRRLAPGAVSGLAEVLQGRLPWTEAVWVDETARLSFLPVSAEGAPLDGGEFWFGEIQGLLEEMEGVYDFIVLDLPPMTPGPDVRAAARFVDGLLLVVGWGTVSVREVHLALRSSGQAERKVMGVVINGTRRSLPQRILDRVGRPFGRRPVNAV